MRPSRPLLTALFIVVGSLAVLPTVVGAMVTRAARASAAPEAAVPDPLRSLPVRRPNALAGIGRPLPAVELKNLTGQPVKPASAMGPKGLVLAVVSPSCPVGAKLGPALGRAEAAARAAGLGFLYLAALESDATVDLESAASRNGWTSPIVRDPSGALAGALEIASTTEVLVFDRAGTLVYRGAVSDQYGPTWARERPEEDYLAAAIQAVQRGERPAVAATEAPGCALAAVKNGGARASATYHREVARILQESCVECHRSQGIAPFALDSYAAARDRAPMIARVVRGGQMPPWFAARPSGTQKGHSPWANDRSLSEPDRNTLLAWAERGTPEGNPAEAPLPRTYASPDGWTAGKPDLILGFPRAIPVKAEGVMPYQNVEVPTGLTEDRWVQSIEVRPGARSVVHHVLVFARKPGERGRSLDEIGGFFGAYVPGTSTLVYPAGYAKKLPAGSTLRFQMHYTPNGTAQEDLTRIGLRFAATPPKHEVHVAGISNILLNIPPGAPNHTERGMVPVPRDVRVLAFLPHMHVRGKACRYEEVGADGKKQTLLDIPRYDFNWQLQYRLGTPLPVKSESRIEFTGTFDNSAGNPANPDPAKRVRWGPQTSDEMLLGYVEYVLEDPQAAGPALGRPGGRVVTEALFRLLDRDGDGKVSRKEFDRPAFDRLDRNQDGYITREEAGLNPQRPGEASLGPGSGLASSAHEAPSTNDRSCCRWPARPISGRTVSGVDATSKHVPLRRPATTLGKSS